MKNLIYLLFLVPFIMNCSKDNEVIIVSEGREVKEYRLDRIRFNDMEYYWSGDFVELRITTIRNELVYLTAYPQLRPNSFEDIYPLPSEYELRVFLKTSGNTNAAFNFQFKPWEHLTSENTFRYVLNHNVAIGNKLQMEFSGTVLTVTK